jgi:hypothetical protein
MTPPKKRTWMRLVGARIAVLHAQRAAALSLLSLNSNMSPEASAWLGINVARIEFNLSDISDSR